MPTIYTVTVDEVIGDGLVNVPLSSVVSFVLPASSPIALRKPRVITNFPSRHSFVKIPAAPYDGKKDWTASLKISKAGAFEYYLEWDADQTQEGAEELDLITKSNIGNFVVDPVLFNGHKEVSIAELCVVTMISRCMGTLDHWEDHFRTVAATSFNAIHFTPIQELGWSGSSYSLYDHHAVSRHLSPHQSRPADREATLASVMNTMKTKYNLLGITDVVWNHAANNSAWLGDHPEATYNVHNCPYLKPAFALDQALRKLSEDITAGVYAQSHAITEWIRDEDDLAKIINLIRNDILQKLRLWEFFVINVEEAVKDFTEALKTPEDSPTILYHGSELDVLKKHGIHHDASWDRHSLKVNMNWAVKLFGLVKTHGRVNQQRVQSAVDDFKAALNQINLPLYQKYDHDLNEIMKNIANAIRYEKVAEHGPRHHRITKLHPLIEPYFTPLKKDHEIVTWAVNNGWIWGGNPLNNFAEKPDAYFRREVLVWSDSIKLRYGKGPEDSPFLWGYMKLYTQSMAKLFDGFRIDNCHSTPLHVAKYLVEAARDVRPNIYIFAELFTGSETYDNLFIAKLGINSLIREAMQAPDPNELGRLCHRYGGKPIGSIAPHYPPSFYQHNKTSDSVLHAHPVVPPALFFDCTHDNELPVQKRTIEDSLSNSALVWATASPVATTYGYDFFVPKNPPVNDYRLYPVFKPEALATTGMFHARKVLNQLHQRLAIEGYTEIHIHQELDLITIQRHNPRTHEAVYFVVHTAFWKGNRHPHAPAVRIPGQINKTLLCATIDASAMGGLSPALSDTDTLISSLPAQLKVFNDTAAIYTSTRHPDTEVTELSWLNFPPGSILVLEVSLPQASKLAVQKLMQLEQDSSLLTTHFANLSIADFNQLLFRCSYEEQHDSNGARSVFRIPHIGELVYAGFQGLVSVLFQIRQGIDMGHPMFNNLREGNWMIDYLLPRLSENQNLAGVCAWLTDYLTALKAMPRYLIPMYFDQIVMKVFLSAKEHLIGHMMPGFVASSAARVVKDLALTSVQFLAKLKGISLILPKLSGGQREFDLTMAAGLPHFSTGYMRVWGRDTFIALPGNLLVTSRFPEAKEIILGFAASCRHGLIPNLLDSGNNPRYNCRDAVWFFLHAVQEYCHTAPEGTNFLHSPVIQLFPTDDHVHSEGFKPSTIILAEVIQGIMQKHASGIHFRERNAGSAIDAHMQDLGFSIDITLDPSTGFISGGNNRNCGTWMDKMGSSNWAHNDGIPATPRDGADIEIIGLLKATLRWLVDISKDESVYPYKGVKVGNEEWTWKKWNDLVQANFEKYFYVPPKGTPGDFVLETQYVHRRGIYKDSYGSSSKWTDYQLRPNCCIAMTVAPELFTPEHARLALETIGKTLVGPLGMKTLDPADKQYRPNYDAGGDSDDYFTAKGFNYHQGPEWLWPFGFYLRAKIHFFRATVDKLTLAHSVQALIQRHKELIRTSEWRGLPELTNQDGAPCFSSCPTQAWSSGCLLSALQDLEQLCVQ